jgi:hypothetical protein
MNLHLIGPRDFFAYTVRLTSFKDAGLGVVTELQTDCKSLAGNHEKSQLRNNGRSIRGFSDSREELAAL